MKMVVTIDDFGRIVLPKAVRSVLGMQKRTAVRIEVIGDVVQLSVAVPPQSDVDGKRGRPIYNGDLPDQWDSGEAMLKTRAGRLGMG